MIKKFEKSPNFVLKEFYKNCGVTKNIFIKKLIRKKAFKKFERFKIKKLQR